MNKKPSAIFEGFKEFEDQLKNIWDWYSIRERERETARKRFSISNERKCDGRYPLFPSEKLIDLSRNDGDVVDEILYST